MTENAPERVDGPLRVNHLLTLPAGELRWRFSRSSGPGGQGVNTTDSRAELSWSPAGSSAVAALSERLQTRLASRLAPELVGDSIVIAASEYRAQLRNREAARQRLANILRSALAPPPPPRRATRRTRGSNERRLGGKKARGDQSQPEQADGGLGARVGGPSTGSGDVAGSGVVKALRQAQGT